MTPTDTAPLYEDYTLPVETRAADLVSRMTLAEKVSQMLFESPAIERLDIPAYNWWNECLHGVGRAGIATVFPQAIGLAATWNNNLMRRVATAISDEARAKHHQAIRQGIRDSYSGLTFWSPNTNIFRDPRWGRGQETYGEDPYLTAQMGVSFVKGLQGDHPRYLKVVATPKHFAVHSGPERERHRIDIRVSQKDLHETYLPAFEACVKEAKAASVMGAYNRVNGEACCASPTLLQNLLRQEWGFQGYVVSDCEAITDIYKHHKIAKTAAEAAAMAVNAGCDLNCGKTYHALLEAVEQGLISAETIDRAATRLFVARFRLGMFDPPDQVPYAQIPYQVNDSPEHRALAHKAAQEAIVLLKNENNLLPLSKNLKTIAVIGPNANDVEVLLGNYSGTPCKSVTPLQGIRAKVSAETKVLYSRGCDIVAKKKTDFEQAVALARQADVAIFAAGLSQRLEGEEGEAGLAGGGSQSYGDRLDLNLPAVQEDLLKAVYATETPVVLILLNGSPVAINWADKHIPAIVEAWYPGQAGGAAIADVLFGDYNPGGRLPITFYKSVADLPPFEAYSMAGRTYRYFQGKALYPFGYGLSYTRFSYRNLRVNNAPNRNITVSVVVKNIGQRAGDEVTQVYVSHPDAPFRVPVRQLQGFKRLHLKPGEVKTVAFTLTPEQLSVVNDAGQRVNPPGEVQISVGGGRPGGHLRSGTVLK